MKIITRETTYSVYITPQGVEYTDVFSAAIDEFVNTLDQWNNQETFTHLDRYKLASELLQLDSQLVKRLLALRKIIRDNS